MLRPHRPKKHMSIPEMSTAQITSATPKNRQYKAVYWRLEPEDTDHLSSQDLQLVAAFKQTTNQWPVALMGLVPDGATLATTCAWLRSDPGLIELLGGDMTVERLAALNKRYFNTKSSLRNRLRATCLSLQSLRDATYLAVREASPSQDAAVLEVPQDAATVTAKRQRRSCARCGERVYTAETGLTHGSTFLDAQCQAR
jgi:hypothetical protein